MTTTIIRETGRPPCRQLPPCWVGRRGKGQSRHKTAGADDLRRRQTTSPRPWLNPFGQIGLSLYPGPMI
jgi:hypothetical protein